jgi:uncharacterized membrane protein
MPCLERSATGSVPRSAYAGVTFALVMATISAYSIGEPWYLPLVLLVLLVVSYLTRPAGRRLVASPPTA